MVQIENFEQLGAAIDANKTLYQKIGAFYIFIPDNLKFKDVEELVNLKLLYV